MCKPAAGSGTYTRLTCRVSAPVRAKYGDESQFFDLDVSGRTAGQRTTNSTFVVLAVLLSSLSICRIWRTPLARGTCTALKTTGGILDYKLSFSSVQQPLCAEEKPCLVLSVLVSPHLLPLGLRLYCVAIATKTCLRPVYDLRLGSWNPFVGSKWLQVGKATYPERPKEGSCHWTPWPYLITQIFCTALEMST